VQCAHSQFLSWRDVTWVPTVVIFSAFAVVPASVVLPVVYIPVFPALARLSSVAALPTDADIPVATGISNVSGVPAIVGVVEKPAETLRLASG
jgi:hypothetical protein